MANNPVLKTIDLTSSWVALADEPLVANVTIMQMSTSGFVTAETFFTIRCGAESSRWPMGKDVSLSGVDLSTLEVSTTYTSTQLVVIGNTR